jgi:chromosome segregation ATPase
MRLTKLKLAGFKSFVDPTTLALPGQLVGVVGPNGCGKSNVMDSVRWVLGESKASELRGESMQDVIFNGSGSRKPFRGRRSNWCLTTRSVVSPASGRSMRNSRSSAC